MKERTRVTKRITTETAHRLLSYPGNCGNVHGHRYEWRATFERSNASPALDPIGMVVDFADAKAVMMEVIHANLDHALVLNTHDPILQLCRSEHGSEFLHALRNPATPGVEARIHVVQFNPTVENLSEWFGRELDSAIYTRTQTRVRLVSLEVHETETGSACYS